MTATVLDNHFVRRFGVELRAGSPRWNSNLGGIATPSPVVSLMSYNPPRGILGTFSVKLFAACENGNIYDVTDQHNEAFVPAVSVAIPGQRRPGQLSWTNFSTQATNFLVVCVGGGGVWTYDSVGGWINRTGAITTNPAGKALQFDFVMSWKNRLWFIEDESADAWYLTANAIQGQAKNFDFGPLLTFGGDLQVMASWTMDSGTGVDDKLVLFGAGGDILVYEGTDPDAASTFKIIGVWWSGRPPFGRRFASKYGGDLSFITENGVEYMSRMLQGVGLTDPGTQNTDPARRFNEVVGLAVRQTRGQRFWRPIHLPSEESVIILTPRVFKKGGFQFCFAPLAQAWSRMSGMPMACGEVHGGDLYFGTNDGTVLKAFAGATDDFLTDNTPGRDIIGVIQTAFITKPDARMNLKRPLLYQPIFQAAAPPKVQCQINTEWSVAGTPGSPAYTGALLSLWDVALWDVGKWGGGNYTYQSWLGAEGLGAYASLRATIVGAPGTLFTGWKYVFESGGIM
jgi:hypothetical protein